LDVLQAWQQASAIVLSCPGPLRRHPRSLLPLHELALPQVFLGGESQLAAFAADAAPDIRRKMVFSPLPEMFSGVEGIDAAFRGIGRPQPDPLQMVHLRFGSVRDARVLKGVANAAVLAERVANPPLTASHHPFASGTSLPAAMQGVFLYGPDGLRARRAGGGVLPSVVLAPNHVDADLTPTRADAAALDLVSLEDFDSDLWAAGPLAPCRPALRDAVLLPWNLAHFGSIVPDLLIRLATLWQPGTRLPPLVLLPFNYLGQTGLLRQLIARLRDTSKAASDLLKTMFYARILRLGGLAPLRKLARLAWVDGNDPESWWTMARLRACGFAPILIDPANTSAVPADEAIWVESDTRYGLLTFEARLPSLRALPALLALTASAGRR
jgi:hypothetical protein